MSNYSSKTAVRWKKKVIKFVIRDKFFLIMKIFINYIRILPSFLGFLLCVSGSLGDVIIGNEDGSDEISASISELYTIEGKVYPEMHGFGNRDDRKWQTETTLSINSGEYKGFLRDDGSFLISGVPSGSYVVEVHNPDYFYEPVRVEINPKGKFRARRVNYVQPSQVIQVPYPLKMKAITRFKYFQTREQWKITDFLFSPMVLMMVLPLLLMLVLPKMISDPETKKELENIQFPKMTNEMPEISEMLASYLSGKKPPSDKVDKDKKSVSSKQAKKRN